MTLEPEFGRESSLTNAANVGSLTAIVKRITPVGICSMCVLAIGMGGLAVADDDDDKDRNRRILVKCDKGKSIQRKLDRAKPGDIIEVRGTCNESIVMVTDRVSLDCKSVADGSIVGTGDALSTIRVMARNVTVANCDVSAGDSTSNTVGIGRGASMTLRSNKVSGSPGRNIIVVAQNSYGRLIDNEIAGARNGVFISSGSMADLFLNDISDVTNGVLVTNSAAVDLVDNIITGLDATPPFGAGVFVSRTATANFSNDANFGSGDNVIQNFAHGVRCRDNSAVRFGSFSIGAVPQDDGTGNDMNTDFEFECAADTSGGAAF